MNEKEFKKILDLENDELRILAFSLLREEKRIEKKREFIRFKTKMRKIRVIFNEIREEIHVYINSVLAYSITIDENNNLKIAKIQEIPKFNEEIVEVM